MEVGNFISSSDDFDVPAPWQAIGTIAAELLQQLARPEFEGATRGTREVLGSPRARPVPQERRATGKNGTAADAPTDVRRRSVGEGWARPSEMGSAPAGGVECRAPGLGGCRGPRRARRTKEAVSGEGVG
jgi:hypothetical protein